MGQSLGWGAPGNQVTLSRDSKITWKNKNLDKDSDFYSLRLLDYQVWLGGHLKWSVIRPNRAKHGTDI